MKLSPVLLALFTALFILTLAMIMLNPRMPGLAPSSDYSKPSLVAINVTTKAYVLASNDLIIVVNITSEVMHSTLLLTGVRVGGSQTILGGIVPVIPGYTASLAVLVPSDLTDIYDLVLLLNREDGAAVKLPVMMHYYVKKLEGWSLVNSTLALSQGIPVGLVLYDLATRELINITIITRISRAILQYPYLYGPYATWRPGEDFIMVYDLRDKLTRYKIYVNKSLVADCTADGKYYYQVQLYTGCQAGWGPPLPETPVPVMVELKMGNETIMLRGIMEIETT